MRKSDKKLNIAKTNILAEQRYLESKGIITENLEAKRGDEIVWVGDARKIDDNTGEMVTPNMKGEYIGRESSGEWVVEFGTRRFHANDFEFQLANQGTIREESNGFSSVRLVNKNDFKTFIDSNPALGTIYNEDTNKYKIYLYADLVGYFDPKLGRIDYEKDSRFAKVSDEYTWNRDIN
jgi:hypothetical protein